MFESLQVLVLEAEEKKKSLAEIVIETETVASNLSMEDVRLEMKKRLQIMKESTQQGLERPVKSVSGISGGSAFTFWRWLEDGNKPVSGSILSRAMARALSVNEVNAGMGCIVATPTAGSAGILPATLLTLQESHHFSDDEIIDALFVASGIGMVVVNRANVSGAMGGCQAETGSAAAMAAGASVALLGGTPRQSAHAVGITLKNMLGLVCDPVAGLVEVPCVKRNAAGVAQCFVAIDLALAGVESIIPPDEVIDAMANIGKVMDKNLKETGMGGLAATPTGKRLAAKVWQDSK
ncbi:MAG: L-serine ammonia-lyase, iron-sulfur-dependent, subunit alpha [Anaerolineae bacterium]|jgi:L-serine dehydratase|nr:L-serine ammonia-lyase, iron-sulfur-dependent, subunit alpha [Anaerolineae bacterium]MBT3711946.1 L-serine ammonia-lyase, iron-sulfur-dependent, subunit alpha [Anaerolineae bacterium]MBT4311965.1 L-serine ammonia-lyase, iron-sulfur-dependent, subunit alpha [Anaerolineae bacterium]MBT4459365.1 L-serine ammonia-lyase, iron-sulfur-dependent, subunit alpha [Anaerolineae bacterium]MBT4841267.1 L-serine ammonia-lyase, iron-sulfur-dependent, subunit alpha [Anaerolineae bacterium]